MTDSAPEGPNRDAVLLMRAGFFLLPAVMLGFALRLEMGIGDAFFASLLLVTLPILALAQLLAADGLRVDRLSAYVSSASTILVLASFALILGALGPGLAALGLGATDPAAAATLFVFLLVGAMLLTLFFHLTGKRMGWEESELIRFLLPRSHHEKRMFVVLSFVAGFGEEIVYRGYLLALLVPLMASPWLAATVASLAFGLLHAYQGALGIVRTGLLGFLFSASFLVSGSLWPAIACHVVVDLVGGLWLGPRILRTEPREG